MNTRNTTEPPGEHFFRLARISGLLYLVIITCGIGAEVFVRSPLIVDGDAPVTAGNILASATLYKLGFAADVLMLLADVAIAVTLFLLFKPVNAAVSTLAMAFRLTQAAVLAFNLLHYHAASLLLENQGLLSVPRIHLQEYASLFLVLHSHGYDLGLLFFGPSTLAMGYLVLRCPVFPRFIGIMLLASGIVYLVGSMTRFLAPEINGILQPAYLVPVVGELSFGIYLVVLGLRPGSNRQTV